MNEYRPPLPAGSSPFADWAQKIQHGAFGSRRMLQVPEARLTQTPGGVFHRPKPVEEDGEEAEQDHFFFAFRWVLNNGIKSTVYSSFTVPSISLINPTNCSAGSEAEFLETVLSDSSYLVCNPSGRRNGSNLVFWPNSLVKLSQPVNPNWVIDIGLHISLGASDFSFVVVCNAPTSDRLPLSNPGGRRFYFTNGSAADVIPPQPTPSTLRWARYYPTRGKVFTDTYIGFGVTNDEFTWRFNPATWDTFLPAGTALTVFGHAHDLSSVPAFFNDPSFDEETNYYLR